MRISKIEFILFALFFTLVGCQDNTSAPAETAKSAAEDTQDSAAAEVDDEAEAPRRNFAAFGMPRGLLDKTDGATPGYVYFSPMVSSTTYLIDMDGQVVHTWESEYGPTGGIYLKDDGTLIRGGQDPHAPVFGGGGQGGWFQEFTWDGELAWEYNLTSTEYRPHHDVALMPNGNYLAIAWESMSVDESVAAGRNPEEIPKAGLWPDWIVELQPKGSNDAEIVWEWHMTDHLIQEFDESKDNFGVVADHPELLDINLGHMPDPITQDELDEKRAADDAVTNATVDNRGSDIYHTNAISYNAELDQIAISLQAFDEIFIIDHSTTTEEAAGHDGGRWGKGGDILYRWGNPQNYGRGDDSDKKLGGQHDVKWIPQGYPGAGNLMVYNNNVPGEDPTFSSVIELATPLTSDGYAIEDNGVYGPESPEWSYEAEDPLTFFSPFISGAHRMANGNTLITEGASGRFFEVDADKNVVWEYRTPYAGYVKNPDGTSPHPAGPFVYGTFRATHIPADHPALVGRELTPLDPQPPAYQAPSMED